MVDLHSSRKPRLGCLDSRSARAVNPGWPAPQSPGARIGKPEQKTGSEGRGYGPGSLLRPLSLLPRVLPNNERTNVRYANEKTFFVTTNEQIAFVRWGFWAQRTDAVRSENSENSERTDNERTFVRVFRVFVRVFRGFRVFLKSHECDLSGKAAEKPKSTMVTRRRCTHSLGIVLERSWRVAPSTNQFGSGP